MYYYQFPFGQINDRPLAHAYAGVFGVLNLELLLLMRIAELILRKYFLIDFVNDEIMIISILITSAIVIYFYFIYEKKLLTLNRYEDESSGKRIKGTFIITIYIILLISGLIFL
jgi:hypothetical protein